MYQFKVGDRVVRINSIIMSNGIAILVGSAGTVAMSNSSKYASVLYDGHTVPVGSYWENLELEYIYHAPLLQALK